MINTPSGNLLRTMTLGETIRELWRREGSAEVDDS